MVMMRFFYELNKNTEEEEEIQNPKVIRKVIYTE